MGANSKQGWYLFLFLIGFTFLPAGMVYLGPIFSLIGLGCLIASCVLFYQIKPLEFEVPAEKLNVMPAPTTTKKAV
jgi:hypothetical protein